MEMKSLKYEIVAVSAVCAAALSAPAVEWSLTVEKGGATNVVAEAVSAAAPNEVASPDAETLPGVRYTPASTNDVSVEAAAHMILFDQALLQSGMQQYVHEWWHYDDTITYTYDESFTVPR